MVKKRKNKFEKFFLLSGRKVFWIILVWFASSILHNLVYALGIYFWGENFWGVGGDEPFFFIIAIILIPLYFIIGLVYSLVWIIRKRKYPKREFYIRFILSLLGGILIAFILTAVGFLNDMYFIPISVFTLLIFGLISLFQKKRK